MKLVEAWIADALVNGCEERVNGDYLCDTAPAEAYARGIVNGVMTVLVAQGYTFIEALAYIHLVVRNNVNQGTMPHGPFSPNAIPVAWREDWNNLWLESTPQLEARMAKVPKPVRVS